MMAFGTMSIIVRLTILKYELISSSKIVSTAPNLPGELRTDHFNLNGFPFAQGP